MNNYRYLNLLTKKVLYNLYIIKKLSIGQISKKYIISKETIYRYLIMYKIKIRNKKQSSIGKSKGKKNPCFGLKGKNHPAFKNGGKFYCIDCKELISDYRHKRCSKCYGIWRSKNIVGDKLYNYIKDRSLVEYPLEFNEELRESIRKRDNYICSCGMTEEEHLIVYGQVLHVHHIDYNKQNCNKKNLISVCLSCNTRANFNRIYWQKFYINKLKEYYA